MSKNKEYAQKFKEMGYERKVIAFKNIDEVPENAEPYGDAISFHCAIAAEPWEEGRKPFYITNENVLCGGAVYSGIGNRKISKEEFDIGMSQTIGVSRGYATRENFRRVNQQIPHHFVHHKYQVIGVLEEVEEPDVVMVVASAYKVMRLCKTYTWKTGELVYGLSGSAWCTCSFPHVFETKTMSFATGDEQSRLLMSLDEGELSCLIHYTLLPLIIENYGNIQTGLAT
jgi:uncharacterized protein (DUF169 family)